MNRPRLIDSARARRAFSGPLRMVASVLIGAVALLTVGPVLGRGFEPGSGPAVLITRPGAAAAASDGWINAVSEALRALAGVRPAEPQPGEMPAVELGQSELGEDSAEAASDEPVLEIAVVDNASAPPEPVAAVSAFAALPPAPASAVEDPSGEDVTDEDGAAPPEPAIAGVSEPPPPAARPRPAPILAAGLGTPPPRIAATPRPQQATPAPTASGQPRATSTPRPTPATIAPTRVPTAVPTPTPRTGADRAATR